MPVTRIFGSKSFTFGLIVRAFTSPEPLGQLRAPDWSLEMVGKPADKGSDATPLSDSTHEPRTASGEAHREGRAREGQARGPHDAERRAGPAGDAAHEGVQTAPPPPQADADAAAEARHSPSPGAEKMSAVK